MRRISVIENYLLIEFVALLYPYGQCLQPLSQQ